jgi:hypothetical protein
MHRDKTLARILLILSVVHVPAAAPAIVRQRSLDVDEDVTPATEKRGNPGDTPQDLYPVPQMDNDRPSALGTSQLDHDRTSALGTSQLDHDRTSALGTPQLDNNPPSALGTSQLDNELSPASGAPHLHNDPPPVSGTPQLDHDRTSALGTPQLHDDLLTASGTSSVHDDLPLGPEAFDESYRFNDLRYAPSSHESEAMHEPEARPTNNYISDAMRQKLISLAGYGVVAGVLGGLSIYGVHSLIKDQSYVSPFFRPSPADI